MGVGPARAWAGLARPGGRALEIRIRYARILVARASSHAQPVCTPLETSLGGAAGSVGHAISADGEVVAGQAPDLVSFQHIGFIVTLGDAWCADVIGDGRLDMLDLMAFRASWPGAGPIADRDDNEDFTILDLACCRQPYAQGCP